MSADGVACFFQCIVNPAYRGSEAKDALRSSRDRARPHLPHGVGEQPVRSPSTPAPLVFAFEVLARRASQMMLGRYLRLRKVAQGAASGRPSQAPPFTAIFLIAAFAFAAAFRQGPKGAAIHRLADHSMIFDVFGGIE